MSDSTAQTNQQLPAKFSLPASGLQLSRRTQTGSFYDVVGRKSAFLGYEHRQAEAWVYPLKILDQMDFGFRVEGYPLEYAAKDLLAKIEVRPESTIFTYSHAAFTVRQIIFAPLEEAGIVMLLDVDSRLPMTVSVSFKPRLRLMWLAGSQTPSIAWNQTERRYYLTEEIGKLVGVVGSPIASDVSVMPYQEEPRDVPNRFLLEAAPEVWRKSFVPIVIAGSTNGAAEAKKTYEKLLSSNPELYQKSVAHYSKLEKETTRIKTPDEVLNRAFAWSKIGIDKGLATNPQLGTGLLAGFRASGEGERPGFAWFFGRDALWTAFATNSYGDFSTTKTALEFLRKYQRADGKIPHEISQSAAYTRWFTDFPYAWAAADATPLYVIAYLDYFERSGDRQFIKESWDSIQRAYRFTAATDTDKNGLVENTKFGHGWVEGGDLYPPHEEIYQQGVWFAAAQAMSRLAKEMDDEDLSKEAAANAEKTRLATEKTFWLSGKDFYAYSTKLVTAKPTEAEKGVNRTSRQERLNELQKATIFDEDTVLPAVPLWFRMFETEKAQKELDSIGSSRIATDWGARILANDSKLYDPLSYHHGSVWGLFTGWASLAAYNYGRPHIGFQALYANVQLKERGNALGYITELLSGDFNSPFGRSSHHQIWSEAMIATPVLRGLFGLDFENKTLRLAPQLPANWDSAQIENVRVGEAKYDFRFARANGELNFEIISSGNRALEKLTLAPGFPLDARIKSVTVNGKTAKFELKKIGDIQRAETVLENFENNLKIVYEYDGGTEVWTDSPQLEPGQTNQGLKIIRATASEGNLHLILEGLGGRTYTLGVTTNGLLGNAENVGVEQSGSGLNRSHGKIRVKFEGAENLFIRREINLPLKAGIKN
ncbi:MAG: GH116 family glycosyl hydrolase [Acidobacteriota bacterium]|nr:GH116 family glycosyl hydrolase [Acidobacteriota bacterium]